MENKLNLEELITKHCYICKDDSIDVHSSISDIKDLLEDFGIQLLQLAIKNAKLIDIKRMNCEDHTPYWGECQSCGSYHNYEVTVGQKLDEQSILDTIKQTV